MSCRPGIMPDCSKSESQKEPKMTTASWNGQIIAQSDQTIVVEGNPYFPPDSIRKEFFQPSETHTTCGWKGTASYMTLQVDGKTNEDACWYYPEPKEQAANIKGYFAFWKGVTVDDQSEGHDRTPDGVSCEI